MLDDAGLREGYEAARLHHASRWRSHRGAVEGPSAATGDLGAGSITRKKAFKNHATLRASSHHWRLHLFLKFRLSRIVDGLYYSAIIFWSRCFPVEGIFSGATGNSTIHIKKPFQSFRRLAPTERKFQSLGPSTFLPRILRTS
jgi:hypothetical protein